MVRERRSGARPYWFGVAVTIVTSFLIVWTTIVRDDGSGAAFFMVILAALVGAFAAWFQPAGMARTMFGVTVMQVALGLLMATAPVIANTSDGSLKALVYTVVIAALWFVSAMFFRTAARQFSGGSAKPPAAHRYSP